jgi:hypothetical protein
MIFGKNGNLKKYENASFVPGDRYKTRSGFKCNGIDLKTSTDYSNRYSYWRG